MLGSTTHVMRDMDSMDDLLEHANSTVNGVEVLPRVKVYDIIKVQCHNRYGQMLKLRCNHVCAY